jgi:hypothetical protein
MSVNRVTPSCSTAPAVSSPILTPASCCAAMTIRQRRRRATERRQLNYQLPKAQKFVFRIAGCCGQSLGGEAFGGERLVRRRFRDIRRRRVSFFLDLGEQPGLDLSGRPVLLRMILGETAGLENDGAQLGNAGATRVVEVHKRKAWHGHRILEEPPSKFVETRDA